MTHIRRRKPEPMGLRKSERIRCPAHLKWVRGHECAASIGSCSGRIEAAHVRTGTDGALSVKPSDCWTLPLCRYHHDCQHRWGEAGFEKMYGINMKNIAQDLWRRSPHRIKYERKQKEHDQCP